MINGKHPNDQELSSEPSDRFISLVLEIDAALSEGRSPLLPESAMRSLSDDELQQLQQTRRRLEQLYLSLPSTRGKDRVSDSTKSLADLSEPGVPEDEALVQTLQLPGVSNSHVGRFEVIRALGMGGHGVVYLARDPVLDRLVALKVPRPDVLVSAPLKQRFLTEGRTAALLIHPNIVTVFESGETGGVYYLAQDYVPGPSLSAWLKDHSEPVPPRVAAQFMLQMAEATALAHRHQILHRDIKPANILLAPLASQANLDHLDAFVPKLTDFGVAKVLQAAGYTVTGDVIGTPAYMSPEQASGRTSEMGVASDVYSLGAVLYELVTHQPIVRGANSLEILREVQQSRITRPRTVLASIPADLEEICLKCLYHDAKERYATAQELADDLRRFLEDHPVRARSQSPSTKFIKWSRRNPVTAVLSVVVVLSLLTALGSSLWYNGRLNESLQTVRQQEQSLEGQTQELQAKTKDLQDQTDALRRRVYADDVRRAAEAYREGRAPEVRQRLQAWLPMPGETDLRTFAWWMLWNRLNDTSRVIGTFPEGATSAAVAVGPSRDVVASGEPDGVIRLRSLHDGRLLHELRGHEPGNINALQYLSSADGTQLVSCGDDGTVRVWNVDLLQERLVLRGHQGPVMAVRCLGQHAEAISSGGEDGVIRIWDSATGQLRSELSGHTKAVRSFAEKKSTGVLFSSAQDDTIRVWDWRNAVPDSRTSEFRVPEGATWSRTLAVEPDETGLFAGFRNGRLVAWAIHRDKSFGKLIRNQRLPGGIRKLAWFSPQAVAVGCNDSRLFMLWDGGLDIESAEAFPGHSDWILDMDAVSGPLGNFLVTISKDGTIREWPADALGPQTTMRENFGIVPHPIATERREEIRDTPHGRALLVGYDNPVYRRQLIDVPQVDWSMFTTDGSRFVATESANGRKEYVCKSVPIGEPIWRIPLDDQSTPTGDVSPDGRFAYLAMNGNDIWAVDLQTGERQFVLQSPAGIKIVTTFPQENLVIAGCLGGSIHIWDAASGQSIRQLNSHRNTILDLRLSRDGTRLASSGEDLVVRIWRTSDWQEVDAISVEGEVSQLDFLDDDKTLLMQAPDHLTFWSLPDRAIVARWPLDRRHKIAVSQDQSMIALQSGTEVRLLRGTP